MSYIFMIARGSNIGVRKLGRRLRQAHLTWLTQVQSNSSHKEQPIPKIGHLFGWATYSSTQRGEATVRGEAGYVRDQESVP